MARDAGNGAPGAKLPVRKILRMLLFSLLILVSCISPVHSFTLSKSPVHYYEEMEKYYQKPRPEMLAGILQVFGMGGILANAKKRMFLAAFLSELVKNSQVGLDDLAAGNFSRADVRATLAWIAHLSGCKPDKVAALLGLENNILMNQILNTPQELRAWNPEWEESTVDMYWGAFMATGDRYWVDAIITAALNFASSGKGKPGRYAAATLYDYLPRHEKIGSIVRGYAHTSNPAHKAMLRQLLGSAGGKGKSSKK